MSITTERDVAIRRERSTRQKRALEVILADNTCFRTAKTLHAELRKHGESVGLTTVYNQLRQLASVGKIDTIRKSNGESAYRLCNNSDHRHLYCRVCGYAVELPGERIEGSAAQIAEEAGFTDLQHSGDIVGLCANCRLWLTSSDAERIRARSNRAPDLSRM